jgi:hypothetical protein
VCGNRTASELNLQAYNSRTGGHFVTWSGIERNKMDYILTDLLPVELSERFSLKPFYDFLLQKEQQNALQEITEQMKKECAKSESKVFEKQWATMPLKYDILKGNDSLRRMSVIQPLSALNIYLFMECFQKDILNFFETHRRFSIRYHRKSNDLYYKTRSSKATQYAQNISLKLGKSILQQTGSYFKISPFDSVNSFTSSPDWHMCNYKYKYFAKIDYKSCFDSIYSHVFTWIIERNVVDSKNAKNSSLYLTIDRMLMNINGKASNGVVVGPEYSRLIAEVLLEQIDSEVFLALAQDGYEWKKDYQIFRYVDDLYIFTNIPQAREAIVGYYRSVSSEYLLNLNELKYCECDTPATFSNWIEKTRILADKIDKCFYSKAEYNALEATQQCLIKHNEYIPVSRMKEEFIVLIKEYPEDRRTIISFLLSTLLNKVAMSREGYKLFNENKTDKARVLVELALFMYAFCPCFGNAGKLISLLVHLDSEVGFSVKGSSENDRLQLAINQYAFIFQRANLPDICDWFVLFNDFNISLDSQTEDAIIKTAEDIDNPIIWANILLYSHYYPPFFEAIKQKVEQITEDRIDKISPREQMLQSEFWYVLIFHNCPLISGSCQNKIKKIVDDIRREASNNHNDYPNKKITVMICDFLDSKSGFFNWDNSTRISETLTYRTFQRTLFKRYKRSQYGLYASIE